MFVCEYRSRGKNVWNINILALISYNVPKDEESYDDNQNCEFGRFSFTKKHTYANHCCSVVTIL